MPARRIHARVGHLFRTQGAGFETSEVPHLALGFEGIAGDRHGGLTRRTGGREPWHARGTEIRNERQLSILCPAELAQIAEALELPEMRAEWLGANLTLLGVPRLSWLPPRTLLLFEGGAALRIDGDNAPCRASGRALVRQFPERRDLEFAFVKAARHRRGLVAFVEKPGTVAAGEAAELRLPEQWLYE